MQGYNNLPENMKPFLIPPLSARHLTPPLFGNALTLIGGFALGRDSWLLVHPRSFTMPENRQFKHQIDNYCNAVTQEGGGGRGGGKRGGGRGGRMGWSRSRRPRDF
ncbi:hypothetical protein PILCRDRAFT_441336 [Piloderma croceum F 1598]|uniref:Uncharacterized protein n=1 Tax=Piloderma croceum (strain F 1598) TaxID=765440 RepID=A0A0C3BAQ1_PILCF|nr:hypothetical protein PILCRDRAFT_441336 [Piloderma croceum F 1598]